MTPVGTVTRGTTARRRLRRVDRWLLARHPALLRTPGLLVVDLGFGASAATTAELAARISAVNPSAVVVGLDIDPARVASARAERPDLDLRVGGFELAGLSPHVVRACNVLRQYAEADVADAWHRIRGRLAPGGLVLEGTVDEPGRLGAWVGLDDAGPRTLTLAVDLARPPAAVAARLPKALIHRNVPGEPIHRLLSELDRHWRAQVALGAFGHRQRFATAAGRLRESGWPVLDGPARWRRGELTIAWHAVVAGRG